MTLKRMWFAHRDRLEKDGSCLANNPVRQTLVGEQCEIVRKTPHRMLVRFADGWESWIYPTMIAKEQQ
jgi:hypothetical protein